MIPLRDINRHHHAPVMLWLIIAANVAVFCLQVMLPDRAGEEFAHIFGMVPRRISDPEWAMARGYPPGASLSFFTSMFLHGGLLHLLFNMWTLAVFGDNVEDRMGPVRFLLFYVLCGLAAGLAHFLSAPASRIPTVGASGAISGVLGAYWLMFPRARIITFVPVFFMPYLIEMPAVAFLGLWIFLQVLSGFVSLGGPSDIGGVAWWAHIGGFVFGMLVYPLFLSRRRMRAARW